MIDGLSEAEFAGSNRLISSGDRMIYFLKAYCRFLWGRVAHLNGHGMIIAHRVRSNRLSEQLATRGASARDAFYRQRAK